MGPATTRTWLCRYEVQGDVWAFRTTDPRTSAREESVFGRLDLVLRRTVRGQRLALKIKATSPTDAFSPPLYVPTRTGFSEVPGSRESFAASVHVTAVVDDRIVDERTFEGACLEFGGVEE